MKKYYLQVSYIGDNFFGSQLQKDKRTVESVLNQKLQVLLKENIKFKLFSRTDKGVHALKSWGFFFCARSIEDKNFLKKLNSILPSDLKVSQLKEFCEDNNNFNLEAHKSYIYLIYSHEYFFPPLLNNRAYYEYRALNIEAMQLAISHFLGEHDFTPFSASGSPRKSGIRTIYKARVIKKGNFVIIYFRGDGFLYKMVRLMVGVLLEIGRGEQSPEIIKEIFSGSKFRRKVAPPYGLYLLG